MNALCIPTADFEAHTLIFVSENNTSTALLAMLAPAAVRADVAPAALLATRTLAAVRADGAPATRLAMRALAAVRADAAPATLLALRALAAAWTTISAHAGW